MKTRQHFTFYEGQDGEVKVAVKDEDGAPILAEHIVGARWTVSDTRSGEPVIEKFLDAGIVMADGEATVTIESADPTETGIYWHELSLRNVLGHRFPVCEGLVYVRAAQGEWPS